MWNVFWRGLGIKPISFYLKQCAVCLKFNKHTLARIVLRFPSLFSLADSLGISSHHSGISPSEDPILKGYSKSDLLVQWYLSLFSEGY